jgi:hypothetical protein
MNRTRLAVVFWASMVGCGGPNAPPAAPPVLPAATSSAQQAPEPPATALPSSSTSRSTLDVTGPRERSAQAPDRPAPLLAEGRPVDWWFAFKFNTATFSGCPGTKACPFGGQPKAYPRGEGEQFAVASSDEPTLHMNSACIGESVTDPVGATFAQIYKGTYSYVLWNDQFYDDPKIAGCSKSCSAPWGHSKGAVAWNSDGEGVVMQVTTPSWPASGHESHARTDGNTLGCVTDDNVLVSQHFFALKLSHDDLVKVLTALANASVVTNPADPQIAKNGGPGDVQKLVRSLGHKAGGASPTKDALSTGVTLLSKPSALHVPPWQMVSALLGGVSLRTGTWWESANKIPSTTGRTKVACWDDSLAKPGPVEIATTGTWNQRAIGLKGGACKDCNHAKIGVVTDASSSTVIFGDMNQEGALSGDCSVSQNGRGGLFFVVDNAKLHKSIAGLLEGSSDGR